MENFAQPKDTDGILYKVVILILISLLLIVGGLISFLVIKKETSSYSKSSAVVPSPISEEGGPLFEGQNFVQIEGFFEKVENGRLYYLNVSNQEVSIILPEEIFLFCNNDITVYEIDFTRLDTNYVSKDFYMSPQQISQEIEPFQQKVILLYKVMGKEISSELSGIVASSCKQTYRQ